MPGPKRNRRERTDEWASIKQWTLWPEQELYEQIRPLVLFHETAGERAKEIDVPQRTLSRKAQAFEQYGMQSLFSLGEQGGARETSRILPPEIRKLQENPLLGEYRVHTAHLRMGTEVSPATCGRIMAANRQLYGLEKPLRSPPRPKLEMPFKAVSRHQYWSCDLRYIEEHLLPDPRPVYVITIFENFSRMVLSSKISATQNQWDYLSVVQLRLPDMDVPREDQAISLVSGRYP